MFRFGFELREQPDGNNFTIQILAQPGYGGRTDDLITTHRVREGEKIFIDWVGPVPTLEDAKMVAACWADLTEVYIATGKKFPDSHAGGNSSPES